MNRQIKKIIFVDHTEVDSGKYGSFLKVYDPTGPTYFIPEKRNPLWPIFKNADKMTPVLATFENYQGNDYVVEATLLSNEVMIEVIKRLGERLIDKASMERNRSTALSYAKDLVIADKLKLEVIIDTAKAYSDFIAGIQTDTTLPNVPL